jgi:dephospho-CoA kinase
MCAGKNRAGSILEKRGFAVVDADLTAHQALVDKSAEVLAAFEPVARERGIELAAPDGSIDRRALGALVFPDPALLARHVSIIYPRINELLAAFIDGHGDAPVVINATMLHNSPIIDQCDFVIFVDACAIIRLFRALRRDSLGISRILARFRAQKHLFAQYLLKDVDILRVDNSASIGALEKRLSRLLSNRGY